MPTKLELPSAIAIDRLADLCREVAVDARVQPFVVEKDYYLTRLIWALAQTLGAGALLKGGTLLSKVDLNFRRMSEDVDLVLPGVASTTKRENALRMNVVRDAMKMLSSVVGVRLRYPHGERSDRDTDARWELAYDSEFGEQLIIVEVTLRPRLRDGRRAQLRQLVPMVEIGPAYCWALDELEARAEKVRAAYTRRAIRDYYDLEMLADAGKDFCSVDFIDVVNRKLAELDAAPLAQQPAAFGLGESERRRLRRLAVDELATVVRIGERPFNLDAMLARFDALWGKV